MLNFYYFIVEPINNGTLRLVGSNSTTEGRVQVYIGDQWVRVCDDGWDNTEAGVVCRQLGFGSSGIAHQFQISGNDEVVIHNFACSGNESTLLSCSHVGMGDCELSDDVGVVCTGTTPGTSS